MPDSLQQTAISRDEEFWDAVRHRCAESQFEFVYAVRTTGVYCRPTCPSRLPRRKNVEFFHTSVDAEQAGYRPCKRCKPRSPVLEDARVAAVTRACRLIDTSEEPLSLRQLASAARLSESRFHRVFKELTGATPKQYTDAIQAERMRAELGAGRSVTDAIYAASYSSSSRFYEKWAWILGMKPAVYGAGGAGELIVFSTVPTPLAQMIVATTRIGVCFIALADDAHELEAGLRDRFHKATIVEGDSGFQNFVKDVASRINRPESFFHLPLDIQGTAFMRQVWSALREIPPGQTRTYSEIAAAIGKPSAARAVANACASNTLAVAIPCHRVIRNDGALGGYRWGIDRKSSLLEKERSQGKE